MEFQNDDFYDVEVTDAYEGLTEPFELAPGITVPAGGYDFRQVRTSYTLGTQHRVSGSLTARRGGFYGGMLTEPQLSRPGGVLAARVRRTVCLLESDRRTILAVGARTS